MIAVPTFQAYVLSRPQGWPAGLYDGTLGEDGLRLFHDGVEVFHQPPDTTAVRAHGDCLILVVRGGLLEVELRPPPPADPRGVALGIAAFLAGGKEEWKRAERVRSSTPWWLSVLALLPIPCGLAAALGLGWWTNTASSLAILLNFLVTSRRGWTVEEKARVVGGVSAVSVIVAVIGVVIFLSVRLARSGN